MARASILTGVLAAVLGTQAAAQCLSQGAVMLSGVQHDNGDRVAIVALEDLAAGTTFFMTDLGYTGGANTFLVPTAADSDDEGVLEYTAPAGGVSAGDIITYQRSGTPPEWSTVSGDFKLQNRDSIFLYSDCGGPEPVFLHGLVYGIGWASNLATVNRKFESGLPPSLADFNVELDVPEDKHVFQGSRTGTKVDLQEALNEEADWLSQESAVPDFTTPFTITEAPTAAPTPLPYLGFQPIFDVQNFVEDGNFADSCFPSQFEGRRLAVSGIITAVWTEEIGGVNTTQFTLVTDPQSREPIAGIQIDLGTGSLTYWEDYGDYLVTLGVGDCADVSGTVVEKDGLTVLVAGGGLRGNPQCTGGSIIPSTVLEPSADLIANGCDEEGEPIEGRLTRVFDLHIASNVDANGEITATDFFGNTVSIGSKIFDIVGFLTNEYGPDLIGGTLAEVAGIGSYVRNSTYILYPTGAGDFEF